MSQEITRPTKIIPTIDAFILVEKLATEQSVDIKGVVVEAHSYFAQDEPYSDLAPHQNDRWHNFLNFGVRVFECTESTVDRNQDVNALLGWFVTSHAK